MAVLDLSTPELAFAAFTEALPPDAEFEPIENIALGDWINVAVKIQEGLHAEITAPYMEAFLEVQHGLYQLAALVKYGSADVRQLDDADRELFQLKVKVEDGSAEYFGELKDAIKNALPICVAKMNGRQVTMLLAGIALLISGSWGWSRYLEVTKQTKIEEIKSQEKIETLKQMNFATHDQAETFRQVVQAMAANNEITSRALITALTSQEALLKAAGRLDHSVIGGISITKNEAKDLRTTARRQATTRLIEQQVRVVDVNTADVAQTTVIFEDLATQEQFRVTFRDALVEDATRGKLFDAAESRQPIWVKLVTRLVGEDVRSVELMGVIEPPPAAIAVEEPH